MINRIWKWFSSIDIFIFCLFQGVSSEKTQDTPFRKNDAFSKPIGEFWDETQPYEIENYPKMWIWIFLCIFMRKKWWKRSANIAMNMSAKIDEKIYQGGKRKKNACLIFESNFEEFS